MARKTKAELLESLHPDAEEKSVKVVANNTLEYDLSDGSRAVQLHDTVIVIIRRNGDVILDSGGWKTPTTKDRMNNYIYPLQVVRKSNLWFVRHRKESVGYYDGMVLPQGRLPAELENDSQRGERELLALIDRYAQALSRYIDRHGIPFPDRGDCWECSFRDTESGKVWGDIRGGSSHLLMHLKEQYVHGSLIYNALENSGYGNPRLVMEIGTKTEIIRAVRRYFREKLGLAR